MFLLLQSYIVSDTSDIFVFACVFISLKGHSFYNLFFLAIKQVLAKHLCSLNKLGNDGRRGISIACCYSHLCYTSYVLCKAQLSLLVRNRVFFPSGVQQDLFLHGSSVPAGDSQGLLSLLVLHKFPTLKFYYVNQTSGFREDILKQDGSCGGHLGFPIGTVFAIFDLEVILLLCYSVFQLKLPNGCKMTAVAAILESQLA